MDNEKILKIIEHYGLKNQKKKFGEEAFELYEALTKWDSHLYGTDNKDYLIVIDNIKEEIADNLVLLNQFIQYFGLDIKDIERVMREKVERTLNRMNDEE